ncbi:unnamed protein product [Moneuplotes crassus]|uniref:FAD dependent oxidoreductase domain-containing protein n=1 Tax=Euplotes crassus TaxID=5936 RepID=A0AAD2CWN7_EUPCR|nr:unnamed protein product [Moneuplotes crassus]
MESGYDIIVVGLGCVGLSTAYQCAKNGLKVLALEQHIESGMLGTSSHGLARIWRTSHPNKLLNEMMYKSISLWKELEQEFGEELLVTKSMLNMGPKDHESIQYILKQMKIDEEIILISLKEKEADSHVMGKEYKVLNSEEIMKNYPAIKNLPEDYIGIIDNCSGWIYSAKIMKLLSEYLTNHESVTVKYNTKVVKATKNSVTLENGDEYFGENVVLCTGCETKEYFDKKFQSEKKAVEYYIFNPVEGLPPTFHEYLPDGGIFYGTFEPDGEKMTYKIGNYYGRKYEIMLEYLAERYPTLKSKLKYGVPCFFTNTPGYEFQYKKDASGVHYAYGFSGTGFKFMPLHGEIVYNGIFGTKDLSKWKERFISKL